MQVFFKISFESHIYMCLFLPHLRNSYTDISSMQDSAVEIRNTINFPLTSSAPNTPDSKTRRKTTHYTSQKAKTIGIPPDVSNSPVADSKVPPNNKSKLNFFGGFRNTLKSKHKTDSVLMDQVKETTSADKSDLQRRWTDTSATVIKHLFITGTR